MIVTRVKTARFDTQSKTSDRSGGFGSPVKSVQSVVPCYHRRFAGRRADTSDRSGTFTRLPNPHNP